MTRVAAVVVAFGPEPLLVECVQSVLASTGVTVDVIVVDNGCLGDGVATVEALPGVRVLRPGRNTGYTGGVRLGIDASEAPLVALVNSDVVVEPAALSALVQVAVEDGVAIATASVRLREDPWLINTAGNPVHFSMLSWAGGHGEPASAHAQRRDVASASGACCVLRRSIWDDLGGFHDSYFAYHEDTELSLRCWLRGLRVVYVPDAVVTHDYDFARNPAKLRLLERNRLTTLLTVHRRRTLLLLAPALLLLELGLLLVAARQGWARAKLASWWWVLAHAGAIRQRRAAVQAERRGDDDVLLDLLTGRFDAQVLPLSAPLRAADAVLAAWWSLVRRLTR